MSDLNDPSQTDIDTASSRIDVNKTLSQLANMLPRVLASDERDARRYRALQRHWRGVSLSTFEIEQELKAFLTHIQMQLSQSAEGLNKILSTPTRVLLYIERATFYVLQDYPRPRELEHRPDTHHVWDLVSAIQRDASAWCKSETRDNGQILVTAIQETIKNALQQMSSVETNDHTQNNMDAQL